MALWMDLGMSVTPLASRPLRGPQAVEKRKFAVFAFWSCQCHLCGIRNEGADAGIGVSRQAPYPEPAQVE
jgi:hypothetical protein